MIIILENFCNDTHRRPVTKIYLKNLAKEKEQQVIKNRQAKFIVISRLLIPRLRKSLFKTTISKHCIPR